MSDTQAHWPGRDVSAHRLQGYFYPRRVETTTNENTATVENTTNVGVEVGVTTINVPAAPAYRWPSSLTAERMLEIRAQVRAQASFPDYVARPLTLGPAAQVAIAAPVPHAEPTLSGFAVFFPGFVAALVIMGMLKLTKLLRAGWTLADQAGR